MPKDTRTRTQRRNIRQSKKVTRGTGTAGLAAMYKSAGKKKVTKPAAKTTVKPAEKAGPPSELISTSSVIAEKDQ